MRTQPLLYMYSMKQDPYDINQPPVPVTKTNFMHMHGNSCVLPLLDIKDIGIMVFSYYVTQAEARKLARLLTMLHWPCCRTPYGTP